MTSTSRRIAFLTKTFPKLSETFILGEVLGLEARGLSLTIFALQSNGETLSHDAAARVRSPIVQLRSQSESPNKFRGVDHWLLLRTHPLRYLKAAIACATRQQQTRWRDFTLACTLARQLKLLDIGHIHAHFASQPAAVAEIACALSGNTFSVSAHAKDIYTSDEKVLAQRLSKAKFVVTCTNHNAKYLRDIGVPSDRVHLMYHGIDHDHFEPTTLRRDKSPLILSVGRLKEKKGFATLIQACAKLRDRGIAFQCEIIGYGVEHERLQQYINHFQLREHVRLTGAMNHSAVIERYRAATVFAAPCLVAEDGDRDGIPNVLLEAMSMALASVTTPVSGIPEVITHGVNGMLVPPSRSDELSACLQRLLGDHELRERLGTSARHFVRERFDNNRNLDVVHRLLTGTKSNAITAENPQEIASVERTHCV